MIDTEQILTVITAISACKISCSAGSAASVPHGRSPSGTPRPTTSGLVPLTSPLLTRYFSLEGSYLVTYGPATLYIGTSPPR